MTRLVAVYHGWWGLVRATTRPLEGADLKDVLGGDEDKEESSANHVAAYLGRIRSYVRQPLINMTNRATRHPP